MHADRLHGRLRAHKNAGEVLGFYRQIRMRYDPRQRIYLIADNLSTHKTPAIREWAAASNIELVFTPTYASFLNRIECHFWGIGEFVTPVSQPQDQDLTAPRDALSAGSALRRGQAHLRVDHGLPGTNRDRAGAARGAGCVSRGDTLFVTKLDRLARSLPATSSRT